MDLHARVTELRGLLRWAMEQGECGLYEDLLGRHHEGDRHAWWRCKGCEAFEVVALGVDPRERFEHDTAPECQYVKATRILASEEPPLEGEIAALRMQVHDLKNELWAAKMLREAAERRVHRDAAPTISTEEKKYPHVPVEIWRGPVLCITCREEWPCATAQAVTA